MFSAFIISISFALKRISRIPDDSPLFGVKSQVPDAVGDFQPVLVAMSSASNFTLLDFYRLEKKLQKRANRFRASDCFGLMQVTAHMEANVNSQLLACGINERQSYDRPAHTRAFVAYS
jgi:hypothetical protein